VLQLGEVNAGVDCGSPPKVLVSEDWVVGDAAGRNRLEANNTSMSPTPCGSHGRRTSFLLSCQLAKSNAWFTTVLVNELDAGLLVERLEHLGRICQPLSGDKSCDHAALQQ